MKAETSQGLNKITWSLFVVPVAGFIVWLSLNVRDLGYRFEYLQPELELDYAVGVLMWAACAVGILMFGGDSRRMLLLGWIGKFLVVLVAMLFYEHHYGLDSGDYFDLRLTGAHWFYPGEDFRNDPISKIWLGFNVHKEEFNPMKNVLSIMALVSSVMPPYFHALKVGFAFIGFLGIWFFYRAVVVALGREYPPAFYLLAFFPSIIFWSSILGKDPLVFLFIGLYAYGGALWLVQDRLTAFWFVGAGILCTTLIRPWMGMLAAAALFAASLLGRCRLWQVAVMVLAGVAVVFLFWDKVSLELGDLVISEFIQQRAEGVAHDTLATGGSGGELPDLQGGVPFGAALLWIIFTGLFRPMPFDITNPFTALAAAENTVVLWLALVAIYRFRMVYFRDPLVLWPIFYSLMWAALHGMIIMANFGSGVRYKLQTWPFLLMAIVLLTHKEGRTLLESRIPGREKAIGRALKHTQ